MLAAQLCCKYVATTRNKTRFHLWYVQQAAACTVTCAHTTVHSAHPLIPLRTKGCVRACKVVYVQLSWKPALTGGTAFQVEPGLGWCYPESASIATQFRVSVELVSQSVQTSLTPPHVLGCSPSFVSLRNSSHKVSAKRLEQEDAGFESIATQRVAERLGDTSRCCREIGGHLQVLPRDRGTPPGVAERLGDTSRCCREIGGHLQVLLRDWGTPPGVAERLGDTSRCCQAIGGHLQVLPRDWGTPPGVAKRSGDTSRCYREIGGHPQVLARDWGTPPGVTERLGDTSRPHHRGRVEEEGSVAHALIRQRLPRTGAPCASRVSPAYPSIATSCTCHGDG
eukprot:1185113-Prorocentrum_minimum.AAC.3